MYLPFDFKFVQLSETKHRVSVLFMRYKELFVLFTKYSQGDKIERIKMEWHVEKMEECKDSNILTGIPIGRSLL